MELDKILNELLGTINSTTENLNEAPIFIPNSEGGGGLYVGKNNFAKFNYLLEDVYSYDKTIKSRFSRNKVYKHIKEEVFRKKRANHNFTKENSGTFFAKFLAIKPKRCQVIAPISGVRLDSKDMVEMSIFKVGKTKNLTTFIDSGQSEYYISANMKEIYDDELAIEIAKDKFSDFIRLIVFISGADDRSIRIKIGLPVYENVGSIQMYVDSSSYIVVDNNSKHPSSGHMQSKIIEKIPLDNPFFQDNKYFQELWTIYEEAITKKNKMRKRILNASISIGESSLSMNVKNSIIYTSMAFEMLFSLDEAALFQASIADKLAANLAFVVGTNKEKRLEIIKDVKKFYGLRSALVHGSSPETNSDYKKFNILLRAGINELLNNEKYKRVNDVSVLYEMLKEAQNSY